MDNPPTTSLQNELSTIPDPAMSTLQPDHLETYARQRPQWEAFANRLRTLISDLLEVACIDYHVIESRAKTLHSLADKLTRSTTPYSTLTEVPDLAGVRIVLFDREAVQATEQLIDNEFTVDPDASSDKLSELEPDQFGYLSLHKVIRLSDHRSAITEWSRFADNHAEIQIRTVLQHAWASVSHKLQYKRDAEIPSKLRRRLTRLAGLFELADDEFLTLRQEDATLRQQIHHDVASNTPDVALDIVSILALITTDPSIHNIATTATQHRPTLLDSPRANDSGAAHLLQVSQAINCTDITQLKSSLARVEPFAEQFFSALQYSIMGSRGHFAAVMLIARNITRFHNPEQFPFRNSYYAKAIIATANSVFQPS